MRIAIRRTLVKTFKSSFNKKMIVSASMVHSALEKYRRSKESKERYGESNGVAGPLDGAAAAFSTFTLIVAVLFLILEFLLLFYAIGIALTCTSPGSERIVHIVLATTFTLPYMLLMSMFNECAKGRLKTGFLQRMIFPYSK